MLRGELAGDEVNEAALGYRSGFSRAPQRGFVMWLPVSSGRELHPTQDRCAGYQRRSSRSRASRGRAACDRGSPHILLGQQALAPAYALRGLGKCSIAGRLRFPARGPRHRAPATAGAWAIMPRMHSRRWMRFGGCVQQLRDRPDHRFDLSARNSSRPEQNGSSIQRATAQSIQCQLRRRRHPGCNLRGRPKPGGHVQRWSARVA